MHSIPEKSDLSPPVALSLYLCTTTTFSKQFSSAPPALCLFQTTLAICSNAPLLLRPLQPLSRLQ